MPIVGFNFTKLSVEKKNNLASDKKIKSDMKIKELKKEKLPIGESEDVLKFNFDFIIEYEDAGQVFMNGNVLFMEDPKKIDSLLKAWNDGKSLPKELMEQILNTVLFKCNIKALMLSQEVNLPPHFRLPRVVQAEDVKKTKK